MSFTAIPQILIDFQNKELYKRRRKINPVFKTDKHQIKMEITEDISIGENTSIKWIEIDPNANDTNIDELLLKTKAFWAYMETQCVSGCCGIDAFAFWPEDIRFAKAKFNDPRLIEYLTELKLEIQNIETDVISSFFLNNLFNKNVFIQLIDHLLKNIK